jgi:phenylalanyl-tRNA synthetase beta chain
MRVPLSWLKDYVDVTVPVEELAERLTVAGLEVETVEHLGLAGAKLPWDRDRVFVGRVTSVHPHPDADRLVLVEVEYGSAGPEVVVTGAPSLLERRGQDSVDLKVAFAIEGAVLYDGHAEGWKMGKLKPSKIRGVASRGMVCSEKELGLSDEHLDIIYLPLDAPVGVPLADYLGDSILTFDIKGPFGHLQSMLGIAREAAAVQGVDLNVRALEAMKRSPVELTSSAEFISLEIADSDLCPRYSAALVDGVRIGRSPFWLQTRLRRAGVRPTNNVVDCTNYVMLELGQPLHAFDYRTLRPKLGEQRPSIVVRRARAGEQMATLDGEMRTFDEEMLLIADGQGPVAVAGVMGGRESEVEETTTKVLLESANFNFLSVRRTSRVLGLLTEAAYRFGRKVDPELTVTAVSRAAHLMADLADGSVAVQIADKYPGKSDEQVIELDLASARRVLGVDIAVDEARRILQSLDFKVSSPTSSRGKLRVTVPSHRQDVRLPIDLVEEIGRIHGYDSFPRTRLRDELPPQKANERLDGIERVRDALIGCGVDEVITYSLSSLEMEKKLDPTPGEVDSRRYVSLRNPLSSERAVMRRSPLPSLLETCRQNLRFRDRISVFEIGAVYEPVEGEILPAEPLRVAGVMTGPRESQSWLQDQELGLVGFYDLKGVVEAMLDNLGLEAAFLDATHAPFQPGRCARVVLGDTVLGHMGELHPTVVRAFDLPCQAVCAFELSVDDLLLHVDLTRTVVAVSAHPPVYEDIALVVDEDVPAAAVQSLIVQTGAPIVRSVTLFDMYRGQQVPAGRKSLAYRLTYQAADRTLTDRAVAKVRNRIVRRAERELGAVLRQ